VLSRTGGTRDLVEEGVNGLTFEWADVATLARHLELLDANRALVRQMAAASRRRAARFGWPAITARFVELFEQVGAEGAGVAR
jgi:phosphatidyl-myo-inositol dimannoside synthase